MENIALWHERDISHSSVERVIAPDATILIDYMLNRISSLIDNLIVYPKNMKANLEKMVLFRDLSKGFMGKEWDVWRTL
jgi:adenylosuccinate lyase